MGKYNNPLGSGQTVSQIKGLGMLLQENLTYDKIATAIEPYPNGKTEAWIQRTTGLNHQTCSSTLTNMEADGVVFCLWDTIKYDTFSQAHPYVHFKYRSSYTDPDYEIKPPGVEPPLRMLSRIYDKIRPIDYEPEIAEACDWYDDYMQRRAATRISNRPPPTPPRRRLIPPP